MLVVPLAVVVVGVGVVVRGETTQRWEQPSIPVPLDYERQEFIKDNKDEIKEDAMLLDEVQDEEEEDDAKVEGEDEALRPNTRSLPPPLDRFVSLPLILIPFENHVRMQ